MIFSQYKENFEILLDYPKIGGKDIKDFFKGILVIFCMPILMSIVEG